MDTAIDTRVTFRSTFPTPKILYTAKPTTKATENPNTKSPLHRSLSYQRRFERKTFYGKRLLRHNANTLVLTPNCFFNQNFLTPEVSYTKEQFTARHTRDPLQEPFTPHQKLLR